MKPIPARKKCTGCRKEKATKDFWLNRRGRPRPRCKMCMSAEAAAWRRANPETHRAIFRRCNHRANLKKRFGITVEQFDALFAACDGLCGICSKPESRKRRLSLDHDHRTGALRGFLCSRCNLLIGGFKDSVDLLERAVKYLQRWAKKGKKSWRPSR